LLGLKIDWIGFFLVASALGCLEVVLDKGQREDWFASNFIIIFASISAVSFALFFPWELTRKEPIVEVRLLFRRQFGTAFLMMMVVGAVLFSTIQLQPSSRGHADQRNQNQRALLHGVSSFSSGEKLRPVHFINQRILPTLNEASTPLSCCASETRKARQLRHSRAFPGVPSEMRRGTRTALGTGEIALDCVPSKSS
jgi:hypothetical protein